MRSLFFVASLASLVALGAGCSSAAKPAVDPNGPGIPSPGGAGEIDGGANACSFSATPISFALPAITNAPTVPFASLSNGEACGSGSGTLDYSLLDMNADGQPDLVVTATCTDATVGSTSWLVYVNEGTGFASAPTRFALVPASATAGCAKPGTAIFDINGDLIPDYVVTSLCSDSTVGSSRWLVYPGSASGFAPIAVPYALPPTYSANAFVATSAAADSCAGGANAPAFVTLDLDGDAKVDFVVTQTCGDASVGTNVWLAYPGGASGASQAPVRFALPTVPAATTGAYASTSAMESCAATATRPTYQLADLDIDGKLDLVVTQACNQATVGTSEWLWYKNGGHGFASSPAAFGLPTITGVPAGSFTALAGAGACSNGTGAPAYTLADINGDATLDLLVTRDCADARTGVSYWEVYPSVGTGFASPRRLLPLPSALGATSSALASLSGSLDCDVSPPRAGFTAAYLSKLGFDLVVTQACGDATSGQSHWLLFPASCK